MVSTVQENEPKFVEEKVDLVQSGVGRYYDEIRFELLSYERASAFKKIGVVGKQIIAEMFERDNEINLYLSVSPELMIERGYKVEKYKEEIFKIVP